MGKKLLKNTEWIVLVVSVILAIIGLVALFSATQNTELAEFKKQIQWLLISIPFLVLASVIDYNVIVKFSTLAYIFLIILLVGVLFTEPISGARSWFKLSESLSFQPSELGKIITILFLAFLINKMQLKGRREINKIWKLFIVLVMAAIPVALIVIEPDNGTAMAYIVAIVFILFASGIDKKYICLALIALAVAAPVIYNNLPEYALKRIQVFLNPELDPRDAGYNILQSKLAIGAGGCLDVFAGTVKRAPEFYCKHGIEWLYRLIKQPSRFVRMLALPKFGLKVLFMGKKYQKKER